MNTCKYCGKELLEDSKFCIGCGESAKEISMKSQTPASDLTDQSHLNTLLTSDFANYKKDDHLNLPKELLEIVVPDIPEELFAIDEAELLKSPLLDISGESALPKALQDVTPLTIGEAMETGISPLKNNREHREGNQSGGVLVAIGGVGLLIVCFVFLIRGIIGLVA